MTAAALACVFLIVSLVQGKSIPESGWEDNADLMMKSESILRCEGGHFVGMDEFIAIMEPITSDCLSQESASNYGTTRCMLQHLGIVGSKGAPHMRKFRRFISTIYSKQIHHDLPSLRQQMYKCAKEYAYAYHEDRITSQSYEADFEGFVKCYDETSMRSMPALKMVCEMHEDYERTKERFIQLRTKLFSNSSKDPFEDMDE